MSDNDDLDFGQTIRGLVEGQTAFGRYQLKRILGRGGMGIVWLAWDEKLEEEIALKFMPEMVRLDDAGIRELKRETRKSLKLTHAHIVRIRDFVEDANSAAIAMEYVDGPTFSGLRFEQPGDVFSPEQLIVYFQQLVSALTYAHEVAGVVHRDLKPANLMVNSLGHLKVADFGISGSVSDSMSRMSMQTGSSGSPPYMSPQQVMGEPTKPTDDIYSVGATIYELLTGKPPFYRGNIPTQIRETVPPSMTERRVELGTEATSEIPPLWDAVVARCLAKNPAERPQSAQQLLDWLEGREEIPEFIVENPPSQLPATPTVMKPQPTKPRNSRNLIIAGVLLGIIILASAGAWWFGYEGPRQEQERIIAQQAQEAEVARMAAEQKSEKEQNLAEQQKREATQKVERERKAAAEKEAAVEEQARLARARAALTAETLAAAREARQAGDWDRAETLVGNVLALDPSNAAAHQLRGEITVAKEIPTSTPSPSPTPGIASSPPSREVADDRWVFPDSNHRYLQPAELAGLDKDTLWRARNEIYVRRGYIFATEKGKRFAQSFGSAYSPRISGDETITRMFNPYEKANVDKIKTYESGR